MRVRFGRIVVIAVSIILIGVIGLVLAAASRFPAMFAILCPQCLSFRYVAQNIYVQRESSVTDASSDIASVQAAQRNVEKFFGGRVTIPEVFFCQSEDLYRRLEGKKGQPKAVSVGEKIILVSPRGANTTILTHELSHIEFHHRLGFGKAPSIPAWFNEGLAAYVSNDVRYIGAPGQENRCLTSPDGNLPTSERAWDSPKLYPIAACRVYLWLSSHGGPSAVMGLIGNINRGMSFEQAYAVRY